MDLWVPLSVSAVVPTQSSPPRMGVRRVPLLGWGFSETGEQRKTQSPQPCLLPGC